jgi:hypothetical protein
VIDAGGSKAGRREKDGKIRDDSCGLLVPYHDSSLGTVIIAVRARSSVSVLRYR